MLDSQSMFFKVREVILEQACSMENDDLLVSVW
jgi:hypothetical protein